MGPAIERILTGVVCVLVPFVALVPHRFLVSDPSPARFLAFLPVALCAGSLVLGIVARHLTQSIHSPIWLAGLLWLVLTAVSRASTFA